MSLANKLFTKRNLKPIVFSSLIILTALANADKPPFPNASLPEKAQGQRAIQLLANKLPDVAAWYGMSTAEFARTLREDKTTWIDKTGHLLYIENEVALSEEIVPAPQASIPYANTFKLHSKTGSNRVIYLDFTGFVTSGTAWANGATIDSPPFTLDTDTANFSNSEMDVIQEVWKRVAEDYAPFDVDVTTEDPGQAAITRSSLSDQNYGTRALITAHDSRLCNSCGGVAYVGVYDITGDTYQPAFVFYNNLAGNAKYIAEATAHEVGHNLGLGHDGTSTLGYYDGHGSGNTSWSPIMGVGYYTQLSQWSKGEYSDANQTQDDMVVIQQNGVLLKTDDHSDAINATATPLTTTTGTTTGTVNVSAAGVIATQSDNDVFSIEIGAGDLSLTVNPATIGTNLDIAASLYDSSGNLLITANPIDSTTATINLQEQAAGTYYLMIDGVGKGDPLVDGYSDYGSLGQYVISGTVPETTNLQAPIAVITPITTQGNAPLAINFDASGSYDNDGNLASYHWNFGDGADSLLSTTSHTFNAPGDYTISLSVTDNDGLTGNASTVVNVANQTPIAVASATPLSGTAPLTIDFSSAGSFDPDTAHTLSYAWNFGDGNTASSANPSHSYNTAGNFTATLTTTDDLGASASDSVTISVAANPDTAPAAPSALTANLTVTGKGKNKTRSLVLNWVDNSANEDNFVLERCQESGRGKSKSCNYSDLTTLAANTTSYSAAISKGTFKYKVRSVNSFGFARSNEVKVNIK